jgi:cell division transport system permease protein
MSKRVEEFNKRRLRSSNMTVVVSIALVLFLLGLIGMILINAQKYSDYIKEQMVVEIFFDEHLDVDDAKKAILNQETLAEIQKQACVKKAKFITQQEASALARKQLGIDTNALFEAEIFPPSIEVTLKPDYVDPAKINGVVGQLKTVKGVAEVVNDNQLMIEVHHNLNKILLWILGFALLFMVVSMVLISNSIKLKIYSKRFIIKTMQLVGAKRRFILKPFLKEAIILGGVGALIGLLLLLGIWYYFTNKIKYEFIGNSEQFTYLVLGIFALGVLITSISTLVVTWKFLKAKTDDLYYA